MSMGKLSELDYVFITGIEGSGTTMMLKLLDSMDNMAILGGNYWSPRLKYEADTLNGLTQRLWDDREVMSVEDRIDVIREIRELELPSDYTHVVHKRSFPFLDLFHFPNLIDCFEMSSCCKVLAMTRGLEASSRSILRRKFVADKEGASQRVVEAVRRIDKELSMIDGEYIMPISYEDIIDAERKPGILRDLADFIAIDSELLETHCGVITRPGMG